MLCWSRLRQRLLARGSASVEIDVIGLTMLLASFDIVATRAFPACSIDAVVVVAVVAAANIGLVRRRGVTFGQRPPLLMKRLRKCESVAARGSIVMLGDDGD
jgi:hypothetical protein